MPVAAVAAGDRLSVSSGSTTASRGRRCGLRRLAFTPWAGERITALRVASAPLPAVVGTAMQGSPGYRIVLPLPITSR